MAGWEQLSREQLFVVLAAQAEVIEGQTAQIEALTAQVAELSRRLGQNSQNSSLPPSADRFARPKRERRGGSARKPGKQPGAPGSALALVADPDEVVDHLPSSCGGCGGGLAGARPAGVIVRQVRDVPLVKVRVVEHRLHKRVCGCGCMSTATAYPATHALCGAHLLRELTAVAEQHPDAVWPGQARSALADLAAAARHAADRGLTQIPASDAGQALMLYRHAVLVGLTEHPRAPGRKQTKARNLLERLRDREPEILRFTNDLAVPFTNNGSERDLRPVKTQIKISGCHRAATGAKNWLRVRGYISTVRKHGDDVLTALHDAINGNPWTPPTSAT